MKKIIRLTESD